MATYPILRDAPRTLRRPRTAPKQTSLTFFPTAARHGTCEFPNDASAPTPAPNRGTKPGSELVGIARLAASSPCAEAKRGTEYFLLPVKSILNHCDSPRVPFRFTVNPYRGCEFGCHYCYARYTHEFMEVPGDEFESKVYVKQDAGALMERDLGREPVWGEHIAIGTATDPYQPAEKDFGATRSILEKIAKREGLSVSITTKSNRVVRDLDLLKAISERSSISVNMSVTTIRTSLARALEPRAPRPDLRLGAVRELRDSGISVGVLAMPIVPGITDGERDLEALAKAASEAGAQWFAGNVLFLRSASKDHFLQFIGGEFPRLAKQYQEWYVRYGNAPRSYREEVTERVRALREKYGMGSRPDRGPDRSWKSPQMALSLSEGGSDGTKQTHNAPYW
ncbi:MAG: radical SAM protein [Candidatus Acidiferrales bacterium]